MLIGQRLIGAKAFTSAIAGSRKMSDQKSSAAGRLERRHAMGALLKVQGDALTVAGSVRPFGIWRLGSSGREFLCMGRHGRCGRRGLGLAIAQPDRKVWVVTGDGEMLMGVGSLASVAMQRPANFSVLCFDNEHYGETGGQRSHRVSTWTSPWRPVLDSTYSDSYG